jgi:hypothetical protein
LTVSVWEKALDATVVLSPHRRLKPEETNRLKALGFYADLDALFHHLGFWHTRINPWGGATFFQWLKGVSVIAPLQKKFELLDLRPVRPIARAKTTARTTKRAIESLLEWGYRQRTRRWYPVCLEFRTEQRERAAGVEWRTQRHVIMGAINGCTWLHVYAPRSLSRRDLKTIGEDRFFAETTNSLLGLRHSGRWFPEYVTKKDRHVAEFWRPQRRGPLVSWNAFQDLLSWRLDRP